MAAILELEQLLDWLPCELSDEQEQRASIGWEEISRIDSHFHGRHDYVLPNNLVGKIDVTNPGDRLSQISTNPASTPRSIATNIYLLP